MKNKKYKYKYKNMSDESLKFGNLNEINTYNSNKSAIFIEIIMLFIFSFFFDIKFSWII